MSSGSHTSTAAMAHQPTWQSWRLFWYGLFYVSLLIAAGLALTTAPHSWRELSLIVGCTLLLGTWYMACLFIPIQTFRRHPWRALGYVIPGWILWYELITLDPDYFIVLVGLYPQVSVFLPFPWNLVAAIVLWLLSLYNQLLNLRNVGEVAVFFTLASGIIGIGLMLFIEATFSYTSKQAHLIEQLQAARRELAQAERLAGIMQERQRLAADIHDTVAQGFSSILLALESVNLSPLASDDSI